MNGSANTILYEAPHRIEKLIEEISVIDEHRELFLVKEISKKFQTYHRGSAKEIFKIFKTANLKGEWVVVIRAKQEKPKALYLDDILAFDLPPKIKAKLLAKITDNNVKEWYGKLISD
jgi:16S rRNA (cytidine1402-2'-O)-methyltransferase